jgi:hypothetical protein
VLDGLGRSLAAAMIVQTPAETIEKNAGPVYVPLDGGKVMAVCVTSGCVTQHQLQREFRNAFDSEEAVSASNVTPTVAKYDAAVKFAESLQEDWPEVAIYIRPEDAGDVVDLAVVASEWDFELLSAAHQLAMALTVDTGPVLLAEVHFTDIHEPDLPGFVRVETGAIV